MGKIIVTYNEVIELRHRIEEQGLPFKLHLHDACGSQSFSLEPLHQSIEAGSYDEVKRAVSGYFEGKGFRIRFSEFDLTFTVEQ